MEPQTKSTSNEPVEMGLFEHLRELRKRLIIGVVAILIGSFAAYPFTGELFRFVSLPFLGAFPSESLIGTGPAEAFLLKVTLSVAAGIIASLPILFYQLWAFIAPGLYESEKLMVLPFVAASTVCFLIGAWFAHAAVLPYTFQFFAEQYASIEVKPAIRMSEQLSFVIQAILAFGVTFELPVLAFFLARVEVIDAPMLIRSSRYAIVIIFILSAILTPPDVLTQFLMAGPLLLLYGISILVVKWAAPSKARAHDATTDGSEQ